jgi:arylformamidase
MSLSNKRIVDISFPLDPATYRNNLPTPLLQHFAGRAIGFEIEPLIERGGPFSVGQIARGVKMRLHTGSHVDAPEHWIAGGKQIHDLPLELFIGDAVVVDLSFIEPRQPITEQDLEQAVGSDLRPGDRLLLRTGWNDRFFALETEVWKQDSPYLTAAALDWCIARRPALVGIDFYHGAAAPGTDHGEAFEAKLASGGILTLTNLVNLGAVKARRVTLLALPLALHGVEAAPVRAVVLED